MTKLLKNNFFQNIKQWFDTVISKIFKNRQEAVFTDEEINKWDQVEFEEALWKEQEEHLKDYIEEDEFDPPPMHDEDYIKYEEHEEDAYIYDEEHEEYDDAHEGTQVGPIEEYLRDREID